MEMTLLLNATYEPLRVVNWQKAISLLWQGKVEVLEVYDREIVIQTGVNRKRQLNVYDPDGTRVELMEPTTVDGVPAPSSTPPPPTTRPARQAASQPGCRL